MRRRGLAAVAGALLALVPTQAGAEPTETWTTPLVRFEPQPGTTLTVDGVGELRGTVEVRRSPDGGGLAVVNELPIEEYLLGLAEVPSTWPAAALEAQAIAARTFAVRSALTESSAPHRRAGADICATQACQVYAGVDREKRDTGGAWAAAVRRTAGRYLVWNEGPIMAKYASSNGGRSDPGGYPYLQAVDDPDDAATSPYATWTSRIPLAEIARVVGGDLVEVNRAADVVVLKRRGQPDEGMSPAALRRLLNDEVATPPGVPVPVPSTRFTARTEGADVVLEGGGYGHLVGMSQYGALGKARRGMSADDILASYYSGIRSMPVDPRRLPPTIRVAVALDEPTVAVRSTTGQWDVTPGGDGVVVAGPALQTTATTVAAPAAAPTPVSLVAAAPAVAEAPTAPTATTEEPAEPEGKAVPAVVAAGAVAAVVSGGARPRRRRPRPS